MEWGRLCRGAKDAACAAEALGDNFPRPRELEGMLIETFGSAAAVWGPGVQVYNKDLVWLPLSSTQIPSLAGGSHNTMLAPGVTAADIKARDLQCSPPSEERLLYPGSAPTTSAPWHEN